MTNPSTPPDFNELINAAYRVGVAETLAKFLDAQSLHEMKHRMRTIANHPEFEHMPYRGLSTLLDGRK